MRSNAEGGLSAMIETNTGGGPLHQRRPAWRPSATATRGREARHSCMELLAGAAAWIADVSCRIPCKQGLLQRILTASGFPVQHRSLDPDDDLSCSDAANDEGEHAGEYSARAEVSGRVLDKVADASVAGDQLTEDSSRERIAHRNAKSGKDPGHDAGQHDLTHDLAPVRAHQPVGAGPAAVEVMNAVERVIEEKEVHRDGDQRDLRFDAYPQEDHKEWRKSDLRQRIKRDDERAEDRLDPG